MYFDEAVNVHENSIHAVLISTTRAYLMMASELWFSCINKPAAYEACITGIKAALDMSINDLEVYRDFILIISQPGNGRYETHN